MAKAKKITTTRSYPNAKVGQIIELRFDSSSPPAIWTERYLVTEIDDQGDIYGEYQETPYMHEFDIHDME
jgi:hypothetical protein